MKKYLLIYPGSKGGRVKLVHPRSNVLPKVRKHAVIKKDLITTTRAIKNKKLRCDKEKL